MKHNDIQLLVYGKDISELNPKIESDALTLRQVTKVQSPNYLFLDITINSQVIAE